MEQKPIITLHNLSAPEEQGRVVSPRAILHQSESVEWYTPQPFVEAVRAVMGGIDLDPASCEAANAVVGARAYYAKEHDGLRARWFGRVFLNPPYGKERGRSNQESWSARLLAEFQAGRVAEAILLVNANTETRWFQPLWAYPICFIRGRIAFWQPQGRRSASSRGTHGSVFVYLGRRPEEFLTIFTRFGVVARVWERSSATVDEPK